MRSCASRYATRPWSRVDETSWRVDGIGHWLWAAPSPRRRPSTPSARAVDSTTPKRSWEPTSTACSCATAGWSTAATPTASTNLVCSTCCDGVRICSRISPTAGGPLRCRTPCRPPLALRDRRNAGGISDHGLATVRGRLLAQLSRLIDNPPPHDDAERFAAHLAVEFGALFTFLWDPAVDATNWRAEQAIRPAVVIRKVCGGNRTRKGADTQQVLASVVRYRRPTQRRPAGAVRHDVARLRAHRPRRIRTAAAVRAQCRTATSALTGDRRGVGNSAATTASRARSDASQRKPSASPDLRRARPFHARLY